MFEVHAVEIGQVLDQRVARPWREHRIARVTQQLEQQRIRLARAGGQDHSTCGNRQTTPREVIRDGVPCRKQSEGFRLVAKRPVVHHRGEQPVRICQACSRGIRERQVDNRKAGRATPVERDSKPIAPRRLAQTRGEHQRLEARNCSRLLLVASEYSSICLVRSRG